MEMIDLKTVQPETIAELLQPKIISTGKRDGLKLQPPKKDNRDSYCHPQELESFTLLDVLGVNPYEIDLDFFKMNKEPWPPQ